jgi:ATP-binding cassette subfamily B protein
MKGVRQNRFKEKRKPKNFKKTIRRLWDYFKFKKKLLLIVLLLVIADSFLVIISPYLIGKAVDYIDFKELNLLNITLLSFLITEYIFVLTSYLPFLDILVITPLK